jgi:hypothetical protein
MAEDTISAHVIRRRVWRVQPLSTEGLIVSTVMATFVRYHGEQTIVFAIQETTERETLWEGNLGSILGRTGGVVPDRATEMNG